MPEQDAGQEGRCVLITQLSPTLCDPMDYGLPGSSGHGLLQARILEWVAMPSSRGSSQSRDLNHIPFLHWHASSLPLGPPGKSRREGRGERRPCGFSFPPASGHCFMKPKTACCSRSPVLPKLPNTLP